MRVPGIHSPVEAGKQRSLLLMLPLHTAKNNLNRDKKSKRIAAHRAFGSGNGKLEELLSFLQGLYLLLLRP